MSEEVKELTEEQKEEIRTVYYNNANAAGTMFGDILKINSQLGPYATTPHYRAIVGAGLTAGALSEMAKTNMQEAKAAFEELAHGLLSLGDSLGLKEKEEDDAA